MTTHVRQKTNNDDMTFLKVIGPIEEGYLEDLLVGSDDRKLFSLGSAGSLLRLNMATSAAVSFLVET